MAKHYGPNLVSDSIIFMIDPMNYKSASTSNREIFDLSRSQYDLVASSGLTWSADQYANPGFDFGVTASNILTKDAADFTSVLTFNIWINFPSSQNVAQTILADGGDSATLGFFRLMIGGNALQLYYANGTSIVSANSPFMHTAGFGNVWINICVVANYLTGSVIFYRNGRQLNTTTMTNQLPPRKGLRWRIGHTEDPPTKAVETYARGKMSQLAVYSRELTAQEVLRNYEALRHRFGV
jgi:hypothetical protein